MPEACCRREPQTRDGVLLSREECLLGRDLFVNKQVPGPAPPDRGTRLARAGRVAMLAWTVWSTPDLPRKGGSRRATPEWGLGSP